MKTAIFWIILFVITFFISIFIGEILLRLSNVRFAVSPWVPDKLLHHAHPKDYKYISNSPEGESFTVYFNHFGLTDDPKGEKKRLHAPYKIAFMGDSFTEGLQVPYSQTFVAIIEKSLGGKAIVKNYGVSSYSPIFYLIQWRHIVQHFKPTHVVLQLYSNDISNDERYASTALRSKNGMILSLPATKKDKFIHYFRNFYMFRFLRKVYHQIEWLIDNWNRDKTFIGGFVEENPDLTQLSTGLVKSIANEIKDSGAYFYLMVVPSKFRHFGGTDPLSTLEFAEKWKNWAHKNSIPFIGLLPAFSEASNKKVKLFFTDDIHFNIQGNAVVAQVIYNEIVNSFEYSALKEAYTNDRFKE